MLRSATAILATTLAIGCGGPSNTGDGGGNARGAEPDPGGGGAIFFVSNDRSGHLVIDHSTLTDNPSDEFETDGYPGIFYQGDGDPQVSESTIE